MGRWDLYLDLHFISSWGVLLEELSDTRCTHACSQLMNYVLKKVLIISVHLEPWRSGRPLRDLLLRILRDAESDPVARRQRRGAQQRQGLGRHGARHGHEVS